MITLGACISSVQELLHLGLILNTLLKNDPAPVDREKPANEVGGCEHLCDADSKLCLGPGSLVADAAAKHSASSWDKDV